MNRRTRKRSPTAPGVTAAAAISGEVSTPAALGAAIAVVLEHAALAAEAWSYSDGMPLIPLLEVGLWPTLQLTLLVPLALWTAVRRRQALPAR